MARSARLLLLLLATLLPGIAGAVSLSADGSGQVLLFPCCTVNGGQDTLLTVGNLVDQPQVVMLRFLEGCKGRPVVALDVYLDRNAIWTAAVTTDGNGRPAGRPGATAAILPAARSASGLRAWSPCACATSPVGRTAAGQPASRPIAIGAALPMARRCIPSQRQSTSAS